MMKDSHIKGTGYTKGDNLWLSVCFLAHQVPPKKGSRRLIIYMKQQPYFLNNSFLECFQQLS